MQIDWFSRVAYGGIRDSGELAFNLWSIWSSCVDPFDHAEFFHFGLLLNYGMN